MTKNTAIPKIPTKLKQFDDYGSFLDHTRSLFQLEDQEYEGLYSVLIKLESIGIDPVEAMNSWKRGTDPADLGEFIRFMILVDSMEIEELQAVA